MSSVKGKARAVSQEGSGAADGIVLPLQVTGSGVYDIAYIIEITVGNGQKLLLQVDTGSSDLWITSRACTSSLCAQTSGHTYDPSASTSTGANFKIEYIQGAVSGPIVWDKVLIGGYSIENQALAAADTVSNEPLSPEFTGILGLALPLNSIIAGEIPPVTTNSPDGAAWASNLFSITPNSAAPASRFLSLSLSRPGSDAIPSLLGIGRHPTELVPDPSKIHYSTLVSERMGTLYWKVGVRAITVYVNGVPMPVNLGRSNSGAVFPSAVLDSGVPLILTTSSIANAIYGAIGIDPAMDGQYYVPCTTPLNLTITLDDRPELPLHPLDLTAEPPNDNKAQFCIGLIQAADGVLNSQIGDIILGVPFMRNVYTVMAYAVPDDDGSFPAPPPQNTTDGSDDDDGNGESSRPIRPRLGLLNLTDPVRALEEFHQVRVLNQPIGSTGPVAGGPNGGTGQGVKDGTEGGRKLSVGIIVLIGLLGFFALCFALFAARWFVYRRRYRRAEGVGVGVSGGERKEYVLTRRGSRESSPVGEDGQPSEDVLRKLRFEAYMKDSLASSRVDDKGGVTILGQDDAEMGYRRKTDEDPWDPHTGVHWGAGDDTLVAGVVVPPPAASPPARTDVLYPPRPRSGQDHDRNGGSGEGSDDHDHDHGDDDDGRVFHQRTTSEVDALRTSPNPHQRMQSVVVPLLPLAHAKSRSDEDARDRVHRYEHDRDGDGGSGGGGIDGFGDVDEFGGLRSGASMAGVGTAARGGKIDAAFRSSVVSNSTVGSAYSAHARAV